MDDAQPILEQLTRQIGGIMAGYQRMLDDEFMFAARVQVPQVATIFDFAQEHPFTWKGETRTLAQWLALIAYRYGFRSVTRLGHGGYAVVLGHGADRDPARDAMPSRRVLRLVPEHHVQNIVREGPFDDARPFDVYLDKNDKPIRRPDYPLVLSDLFLLPRHATRLVFYERDGQVAKAGGHPAVLHCQLMPEVKPLNSDGLDQMMAREAGEMLEAALATLGVRVADAHGGNGGVIVGQDGRAMVDEDFASGHRRRYVPLVLDYGYYAGMSARQMARLLALHRVRTEQVRDLLRARRQDRRAGLLLDATELTLEQRYAEVIDVSGLHPAVFGRLLHEIDPPLINPSMWISRSEKRWVSVKEQTYPPLSSRVEPAYDEFIFPQRVESHDLTRV